MSQHTSPGDPDQNSEQFDPSEEELDVTSIANAVRRLIWGAALVLPFGFAWLQLKDLDYGKIVQNANPTAIRHIALALYYLCWVQGSQFDLKIQDLAYAKVSPYKKLPLMATILIVVFCIIAFALFWVSDNDQAFAVVLGILFAANIIGFIYILWFVRPFVRGSRNKYVAQSRHYSLLRLETVEAYMFGLWQLQRFVVGAALVGMIIAASFYDPAKAWLSHLTISVMSAPELEGAVVKLFPSLAFVMFVVVVEGWIWLMRLGVRTRLAVINAMARRFAISPRSPAPDSV